MGAEAIYDLLARLIWMHCLMNCVTVPETTLHNSARMKH